METLRWKRSKFGESLTANTEPSLWNKEGVETRRFGPTVRKNYGQGIVQTTNILKDGSESYSGMNDGAGGSIPPDGTTTQVILRLNCWIPTFL